jgi:hypothetical protein
MEKLRFRRPTVAATPSRGATKFVDKVWFA